MDLIANLFELGTILLFGPSILWPCMRSLGIGEFVIFEGAASWLGVRIILLVNPFCIVDCVNQFNLSVFQ